MQFETNIAYETFWVRFDKFKITNIITSLDMTSVDVISMYSTFLGYKSNYQDKV